jgi:hypothetical protein
MYGNVAMLSNSLIDLRTRPLLWETRDGEAALASRQTVAAAQRTATASERTALATERIADHGTGSGRADDSPV